MPQYNSVDPSTHSYGNGDVLNQQQLELAILQMMEQQMNQVQMQQMQHPVSLFCFILILMLTWSRRTLIRWPWYRTSCSNQHSINRWEVVIWSDLIWFDDRRNTWIKPCRWTWSNNWFIKSWWINKIKSIKRIRCTHPITIGWTKSINRTSIRYHRTSRWFILVYSNSIWR